MCPILLTYDERPITGGLGSTLQDVADQQCLPAGGAVDEVAVFAEHGHDQGDPPPGHLGDQLADLQGR